MRPVNNRRMALLLSILFIFLSLLQTNLVYAFEDNFDGTAIDSTKWNKDIATSGKRWCSTTLDAHQSNPGEWLNVSLEPCHNLKQVAPYGSITISGGQASFSAGSIRTFPYIWAGPPSRSSPFPSTGNFILEVRMKYDSMKDHGDGLIVPFWTNTDPVGNNPPIPFGQTVFFIWGDTAGLRTGTVGEGVSVSDPLSFHDYRMEYINGKYSLFVDGALKVGSKASSLRPNTIWTGNPVFTHWGVTDWTDFTIDYIRVTQLEILTNVRVIDTISTSNIDLDSTSFSKAPYSITADTANNKTIIEWQYDSFSIGQIEDLSFDVILKNPVPGEDRIVNHKLELLYTDVNGNQVKTELGSQSVHVLASAFTTSVFTDKTEYSANEDAKIGLSITNLSEYGKTISAVLEIKDIKGNLVTTVKSLTGLSFVSGETKSYQGIIWNTGSTPSGDYMVYARLMDGTTQVGDAKTSFKIIKQTSASSKITSDKTSYSSNETVTLTSTVTSQSINSTITKLTAKVSVIDPNGSAVFSETKSLPDLLTSARYEFKSYTNTGINPSGTYTATLEVRQTGELLSVSSTSFTILSSLDQAKALSGTIMADPGTIFEKETSTLTYTAQNTGNDIDLPMIQLDILIVDPDSGIAVRTMIDETSLNGREVFQNSILLDSTGLAPKSYLVVLEGITSGIIQTLASTGLIVVPIPNSAPIANAGADQSGITGQAVNLDGTKSSDPDGDPISYAWHVESVPSGSLIIDTSLTGASAPKPSFIPDIEGTYILSLVVNDGLLSSQQDLVSVFVNPVPNVAIHPETINLKSNGGSKSITGILSSPLLVSFASLTKADGVTVTASFTLENRYIDKNGAEVVFTVPQDDYTGDDYVMVSDSDGNGIDDTCTITLKFNRDLIIAGFKDQNGKLKITKPTDLISTIIGNGIRIGSDTNLVISPPEVK